MRRRTLLRGLSAAVVVAPGVVAAQNPALPPPTQPPVVTTPAQPRPAQQAVQQATGKSVTNAEISSAIQHSGLSQAQLHARLRSAAYGPGLADPFFIRGRSSWRCRRARRHQRHCV